MTDRPFSREEYPRSYQAAPLPGQVQGVYISLSQEELDATLEKFTGWFSEREEVFIVDSGTSDKQDLGFIIIEWEQCQIDALFLAILRDDESIEDYTAYGRRLEV
jgi:hypothetical protein